MARINIGSSHDNSTLSLNAVLLDSSQLELEVGDGLDMSLREISIIERTKDELEVALRRLDQLASAQRDSPAAERLRSEVARLSARVQTSVEKRKWYSISAAGLVKAAKLVGTTADPLVGTALKVVDLLKAARA